MNKALKLSFVAFFLFLLPLPLFGLLLQDKEKISITEQRKLATFPEYQKSKHISEYISKLEAFFNDHYGSRLALIKIYNLLKVSIGDSPIPNVMLGKNDWLFYVNPLEKSPMRNYRNLRLLTPEELSRYCQLLEERKDRFGQKGIRYIFFLAPNKESIYGEYMPSYIKKALPLSAYEQLHEYLLANCNIPVVDLRSVLLEAKDSSKNLLYWRTDSHWNYYGANIAQYEVMKKLKEYYNLDIEPRLIPDSDFEQRPQVGGDLAGLLGLKSIYPDETQLLKFNFCAEKVPRKEVMRTNPPIHTECPTQKYRALIFRDSFFNSLQPFFSEYFKETLLVWSVLGPPSSWQHVQDFNPDIVIEERAERFIFDLLDKE